MSPVIPFDPQRYKREHQNLRASERLDVLEPPPPPKGCNASVDGKRCGRRVVLVRAGPFSVRRLCRQHQLRYYDHDRILAHIRSL